MNDVSVKTEHTEGNWSGELDSADGGKAECEKLLLHFRGGGVGGPHPDAVFQPIAEVFVDLHPRVRRRTCRRKTWKKHFCTKTIVFFFFCFGDGGTEAAGSPSEKISQRRTPNDQTSL